MTEGNDLDADSKYYASRNRSVISQGLDRPGRHGQAIKPLPVYVDNPDDTSSDKYYAAGGSQAQQAAQAEVASRVPDRDSRVRPQAGGQYRTKTEGDLVRPLRVRNAEDAVKAAERTASLLKENQRVVFIEVTDEARPLIQVQLDLQITRGYLTDSLVQSRVRLTKLASSGSELADQMFGKVDPSKVPLAKPVADEMDAMPADEFADFVKQDEVVPFRAQRPDLPAPAGPLSVPDAAGGEDLD